MIVASKSCVPWRAKRAEGMATAHGARARACDGIGKNRLLIARYVAATVSATNVAEAGIDKGAKVMDGWNPSEYAEPYGFEELGTDEIRSEYPRLWVTLESALSVTDLRARLGEREMGLIISVLAGTCGSCLNAPSGCQCWNDE